MTVFRARRRGQIAVELSPYAAGLLASLVRQLVELLSDGEAQATGSSDPLEAMLEFSAPRDSPQDPALLRLLPDAHPDDPEASAEFRRFTERTLREGKVADAFAVLDKLGDPHDEAGTADLEFELTSVQARAWMRCITDLRLTLAERIGITADDAELWDALAPDDDRMPIYEIYGWLSYLLESLIDAVQR